MASSSLAPVQEWKGDRALGAHPTLGLCERDWLALIADQRGHRCEVTGEVGSVAVHHLDGVQTHSDLRWTDSNVICIATWLHVEFHFRWMGGFRVPCTRADFEAFVAYKQANGGVHQQLHGYEQPSEFNSRTEHTKIYRRFTGLESIPDGKQLWSTCLWQTEKPESQLNQYVDAGLVASEQFHGVSEYADCTENNRLVHPAATFHQGEWVETLLHEENFSPAMVIITANMISGARALNLVANTMKLCPVGTVLIVQVIQESYLQPTLTPAEFVAALDKIMPDLESWMPDGVENYHYDRGENSLRNYAFMRE